MHSLIKLPQRAAKTKSVLSACHSGGKTKFFVAPILKIGAECRNQRIAAALDVPFFFAALRLFAGCAASKELH